MATRIALILAILLATVSLAASPSDIDATGVSNVTIEREFATPYRQVWVRAVGSEVVVRLNFNTAEPDTKKVPDGDTLVTPEGSYFGVAVDVGGTSTDVKSWHWK